MIDYRPGTDQVEELGTEEGSPVSDDVDRRQPLSPDLGRDQLRRVLRPRIVCDVNGQPCK